VNKEKKEVKLSIDELAFWEAVYLKAMDIARDREDLSISFSKFADSAIVMQRKRIGGAE